MYPMIRLAYHLILARCQPPLAVGEPHISTHICRPWDIDVWGELNNGRTLTLYDLGRFSLFQRLGIIAHMRRERWAGTVAGGTIRYRARVRAFDRLTLRSTLLGWDHRFSYIEHSLWRGETCCSHAVLRMAVTDRNGLVTADRAQPALGLPAESPPLPAWVTAWIAADAQRPWPPA